MVLTAGKRHRVHLDMSLVGNQMSSHKPPKQLHARIEPSVLTGPRSGLPSKKAMKGITNQHPRAATFTSSSHPDSSYFTRRRSRKQINRLKDECWMMIRCASNWAEKDTPEFEDAFQYVIVSLKQKCQRMCDLVRQQEQIYRTPRRYVSQTFDVFRSIASAMLDCKNKSIQNALIHDRNIISSILQALTMLASCLSARQKAIRLTSMDQWFERFLLALPHFYISQLGCLVETLQGGREKDKLGSKLREISVHSCNPPPISYDKKTQTALQRDFLPELDLIQLEACYTPDELVGGRITDELLCDEPRYKNERQSLDYESHLQLSYMDAIREPDIDCELEEHDVEYDDGEEGRWIAKMSGDYGEDSEDDGDSTLQGFNSNRMKVEDSYRGLEPESSSPAYFLCSNGLLTTDLSYGLIPQEKETREFNVWQPTEQRLCWTGEDDED